MNHMHVALATMATVALAALVPAERARGANKITDPLSFFAGATESISTVKVVMKKPFKSRSIGHGKILSDHSLDLVQRVEDDGKPPKDRRWKIRQVAPGRFVGTMSEAVGPVTIEESKKGYRFRFKLKDNLSVEQWLLPIDNGTAARSKTVIKKFGLTVARSDGMITRIN